MEYPIFVAIMLLINIGIAHICGGIFENKGYSYWTGFIAGALFSIWGLLLATLLKSKNGISALQEHEKNLITNLSYKTPRDLIGIFFSPQTTREQKKAIWQMRKLVIETKSEEITYETEVETGEYVETLEDGTYIHRDKYSQERTGKVTDSNYTYWLREKKVSDWDGDSEKHRFTKTEKSSYTKTTEITLEEEIRERAIPLCNPPSIDYELKYRDSGGCAGCSGMILVFLSVGYLIALIDSIQLSMVGLPLVGLLIFGLLLLAWSYQGELKSMKRERHIKSYIANWINTPPSLEG
jgi:hypothetical protein